MPDDSDLKKRAAEIGEAVNGADERRAADTDALAKICDAIGSVAQRLDDVFGRLDKLESSKGDAPTGDDEPKAISDSHLPAFARKDRDDKERRNELARVQGAANEVAIERGQHAPPPLSGETVMAYRRRLLGEFRADSKDFAAVDLWSIEGAAFDAIEKRIYADAKAAAQRPFVPAGKLVARNHTDSCGRTVTTYYGEPKAWMSQFEGYKGSVKAFRPPTG